MYKCPVCEFTAESKLSMSAHFRKHPFIDKEKYWNQFHEPVLCACGCGETTEFHRGKPNKYVRGHNNRGRTFGERPEEVKRKIGEKHRGKKVSRETRKKISEAQSLIWTTSRRDEARERASKENHPNWKGGRTKELRAKSTNAPKEVIERVRKRDKNTCQMCGKGKEGNGRNMDVHHIVPYLDSKDNAEENLICLCKSCHTKADRNKLTREQIIAK